MPPVNPPLPDRGGARPRPLHEHVKRRISEAILCGLWPPGTQLAGEIALAAQFGVAVGTLRRALADLTAEGLLVRRRKSGTAVTGRAPQHSLRFFFQYFRLHGADGSLLHSTPEVLSLARDSAGADAAGLDLGADEAVIRLHRLRSVGGRKVMHERLVLPAQRLPGFPTGPAAVPALLYLHLLDQYDIRVAAVRENVSAELATAADGRLLHLDLPDALLVIDETAYDQAGRPVILSHHRATTRGYRYVNEIR